MNYGQKIAELRKSKKLTQAELGAQLNITAQAVSKWENNLSEPDIDSIRKMCSIFGISVDSFLGNDADTPPTGQTQQTAAQTQTVKIINGYCEHCKKPVGPGEYKIAHFTYNPGALLNKVTDTDSQHIYCNACHKNIEIIKAQETKKNAELKEQSTKAERKREIKKGLIWGSVACSIAAIILFVTYAIVPEKSILASAIVGTVGAFTLTAEMFWDCFITDFFLFFCRSFTWPFGFIFELSLDGILWLITVKLALWVIGGILSIAFFLIGLVLSIILSIICFPFILINVIRNPDALA